MNRQPYLSTHVHNEPSSGVKILLRLPPHSTIITFVKSGLKYHAYCPQRNANLCKISLSAHPILQLLHMHSIHRIQTKYSTENLSNSAAAFPAQIYFLRSHGNLEKSIPFPWIFIFSSTHEIFILIP